MSERTQMSDILGEAIQHSEFGFFIVPDKFDVLSRHEVKEWLRSLLEEMDIEDDDGLDGNL